MSNRITNRKLLKTSAWLANVAVASWREVQPPPVDGLKLRQLDLVSNLNVALAVQNIRDAFDLAVGEVGESPARDDRVATDGKMAVAIHKALDGLTVREASDADFWAYMACFGCAQYVRWRWDTPNPGPLWSRFAGNIRRNAVARLWWWAEITRRHSIANDNPRHYEVTKKVRGRQTLMLWFVDCAFSGHAMVAHELAALQETVSLNDPAQAAVCRTVNRLARVVCLDSITTAPESETLCQRALAISRLL